MTGMFFVYALMVTAVVVTLHLCRRSPRRNEVSFFIRPDGGITTDHSGGFPNRGRRTRTRRRS